MGWRLGEAPSEPGPYRFALPWAVTPPMHRAAADRSFRAGLKIEDEGGEDDEIGGGDVGGGASRKAPVRTEPHPRRD